MNAPGFWDDQATAARVSSDHARTSRRLEGYRTLTRDYEDARELAGMDGGEMEGEIAAALLPLRGELDHLQEAALFDGEYDAGDAVVTLQSGTGGTDAQDWAEMMLRMYERWGANRGFKVELLEASPGEEAGLKSATFTVGGENAYGILKAERGKHRLVRQSPFDQAHRRHTAFSTVIVAPLLPDDTDVEIDEGDLQDRHLPRAGRRRPAREQDRQRGPDHPPTERDRRAVPERALPVGEQADRDAGAQGPAGREGRRGARGADGERAGRLGRHRFRRGVGSLATCSIRINW